MRGNCALCLKEKKLQKSHLTPKFVYKRLKGKTQNSNPIMVNTSYAVQTSKQSSKYLLCNSCEQIFSRNEREVAPLLYQKNGEWLGHRLKNAYAKTDDGWVGFRCQENDISFQALAYFGIGIIWRHSVGSQESLGPYSEVLRRYLSGDENLPSANVAILLIIPVPSGRQDSILFGSVSTPSKHRYDGVYMHEFTILGFCYYVFVGQKVPFSEVCLLNSSDHPIMATDPTKLGQHHGAVSFIRRHGGVLKNRRSIKL